MLQTRLSLFSFHFDLQFTLKIGCLVYYIFNTNSKQASDRFDHYITERIKNNHQNSIGGLNQTSRHPYLLITKIIFIMCAQDWPRVGQYIDFKDREHTWGVGLVLAKMENWLKIRNQGWPPKHDENIPYSDDQSILRNTKFQPFRSIVRGYTGVKKSIPIRQYWKFTRSDLEVRLTKLQEFQASMFQKSAEQLNQYFRGEHYFYLDFLMTITYTQVSDLAKVYQYFFQHINLVQTYINRLIERGIQNTNVNLKRIEREQIWNYAYEQCYYQFIDAFFSISGLQVRLHSFLKNNENNIKEIVGMFQKHQYYICNQIYTCKLFDNILDLITHCHSAISNGLQEVKLPFAFCFSLFQLFLVVQQTLALQKMKQKTQQIFDKLFSIINRAFQQLEPNDMKQVQIDRQMEFIFNWIRDIASKYNKEQLVMIWPEQNRMKVCMLHLRCDKLQKKLRGLTKLKQIAQNTLKDQSSGFTLQNYNDLLHQTKCLEELFTQNEHIQIYKKSTEFISLLYKSQMITIDELCFIWNTSINKHGAIVTLLFQYWIEMSYSIQLQDLDQFARIAILDVSNNKSQNYEYYDFFFDLIISIINSVKNAQSKSIQIQSVGLIDRLLSDMIKIAYNMLIRCSQQPQRHVLVSRYGSIILESNFSINLIQDVYQNLFKKQDYNICLEIMHQVYVNQQRLDIYLPNNMKNGLIQSLKNSINTKENICYILSIIFCISSLGQKHTLKPQQLLALWQYFRTAKQSFKQEFYQWILPAKTDDARDNIYANYINTGFSNELKRYLLSQIFNNQECINYSSLTKKEVSIIIQLFIQVNTHQNKLEKKKVFEHFSWNINRIKTIELTNQNILWKIFQTCKQSDIIHQISRYLIKFYFYFSPSLSLPLRKSRIDDIMEKIINNIKSGYEHSNTKLMRYSLWLLKYIFQLVKEDDRGYLITEEPSPYKVKMQYRHQNIIYRTEYPENDTIFLIKNKLAEKHKIKPQNFKLLSREDDHCQQLDYTYKNVTISALRRCLIEIVEVDKDQDTVLKFVTSYINQDIQHLFINMLQNQTIATEVFLLIQELDLKIQKTAVLLKIGSILQKYDDKNNKCFNVEIYYHLLQLKIYNRLFEKESDIANLITTKSFKRLLSCMRLPITEGIQFNLLYKTISFLYGKIIKKLNKPLLHTLNLPQLLFTTILQISNYQVAHKHQIDSNVKQYSVKIIQNSNNLIEIILGQDNMINFYALQPGFSTLVENIYMNHQIEQIRLIFTQRLSKYLSSRKDNQCFEESVENYLLHLFIDQMYFKIKHQQLSNSSTQDQYQGVLQFCIILSKIINNISPQRFNHTQIIQRIHGKSSSLFQASIQFIQSLKLLHSTSDFHWNYLLCGHFHILTAIYQSDPSLLQPQIISFVLQNCLALKRQPSIQPLCKQVQHINEAFKFLQQILSINRQIDYVKLIIQTIEPCHQVQLWRTPLNWNINVRHEQKQKYRGLFNPGCICYMNSLLQQLFNINEFRLAVLDIQTTSTRMNEERDSDEQEIDNKTGLQESQVSSEVLMLQGLKQLFLKLKFSDENNINPSTFARTLKTNDKKQMIKFNEQMDIDEFASILFQKIEKGLFDLGYKNFIKQLFGGIFAHQIISKQCSHKSQREQEFISVSLQVKQNIHKSFQSLVKAEILDGGNKYHCQKCDKKVKAEKVQTIKKLPPYLILCLKRFQFDYDVDAKIKINQYCEFPHELNLLQYSQQEILKTDEQSIENQEQIQSKYHPSYFDYQLKGLVVHTGSADSGHYYSLIDKDGNWFQFNDEQVLTFDKNRIGDEGYGCKTHRYEGKTKNAYLLLYERKHQDRMPVEMQQRLWSRSQNKIMIDKIIKKNRQIHKYQILFSEEYDQLVRQLGANIGQLGGVTKLFFPWFQFYLSYFFLIKIRKQNYQYFMILSKIIETQLINNIHFSNMFLHLFTSPKFIEQYFIYNHIRDKCRIIAHLFGISLQKHYDHKNNQPFQKNQLFNNIMKCLKAIFILHGPVTEIVAVLSKYFQYLAFQKSDLETIYRIIENYSFEKILFNFAFNLPIDKKTKLQSEHYCKNKNHDIPFLAPIQFSGKRYNIINFAQIWKLIGILLNICNQFMQEPNHFQLQVKDLYLNNNRYFRECLRQPNLQLKILNLLIQISSFRAIYYFYHAMKELDFNYKILTFFDKAFKDYQSIKYRPFFLYIEFCINDPQSPINQKQKVLHLIERAYKENQKFFLEMDIIHQWILRFVSMNEQFLNILQSKIAFTQEVFQKISKSPYPLFSDLSKKFKNHTNERLVNRYLGILVATETKQYEINAKRMKKQFEDIRNYKFKALNKFHPPKDSYSIGDQVQIYDFVLNKWKRGTVIQNNFGQLTVIKDGKNQGHNYLWQDSEKIRIYIPNDNQENQETPAESDVSYQSDYSNSGKK